jgi:hypothetical protein
MESKSKNTIRICSSRAPRLKQQWNQMFWTAKKLGCGIAAAAHAAHGGDSASRSLSRFSFGSQLPYLRAGDSPAVSAVSAVR